MALLYFARGRRSRFINDRRKGRNQSIYAGRGRRRDLLAGRLRAGARRGRDLTSVATTPSRRRTPVDGPTPVERPRSLDSRYDDIT